MPWPRGWVDDERFGRWLTARDAGTLDGDRREDLYLACACADGTREAIAAFEERHFVEIDRAIARLRPGGLTADELRQRLRQKLFVGDGERPPAIAAYSGRGPLSAWFRAITTRVVLDHLGAARERPTPSDLFDALASADEGTETGHMRVVYRAELRAAFEEATARLEDRERNLLRYAFVDGLSVDGLAAVYKIHRATAARRLQSARESLGQHLRDVLTERLKVSDTELGSIVRLVMSSVDLSVARYLGRAP